MPLAAEPNGLILTLWHLQASQTQPALLPLPPSQDKLHGALFTPGPPPPAWEANPLLGGNVENAKPPNAAATTTPAAAAAAAATAVQVGSEWGGKRGARCITALFCFNPPSMWVTRHYWNRCSALVSITSDVRPRLISGALQVASPCPRPFGPSLFFLTHRVGMLVSSKPIEYQSKERSDLFWHDRNTECQNISKWKVKHVYPCPNVYNIACSLSP